MDGLPCPLATELSENAGAIQLLGNFTFSLLVHDNPALGFREGRP
jgi:hypothetical protein